MKKSKLSIGLVTSFIASMALSACGSDVTKNAKNLVDGTDYNGKSFSVLIDEMYDDYMKSSTGISKYYDQVMEVLIRNAFQKDKTGSSTLAGVKKNYNQIVNEAKDNVKGAKETAEQNAKTNGTSYKTEWQSTLKEKGVKDEEELLQYYIYQLEKEEIEDWYFEKHEDELKAEYLGVDDKGQTTTKKVSSRFPYHIRHILVKVEDSNKDFARGSITSTQAKLLSNTVELLAQGVMTFGEVALQKSEDSSASSYGDVGLMTNAISGGKLSMVNEFQLGIYAYDAIKKNADSNESIRKGLGLDVTADVAHDKTTKQYFEARGIVEVPYSVFKELGDVAELEANYKTGIPVEDGKSAIFPRNILWNTYLNNHSIFVITNGSRVDASTITQTNKNNIDKTSSADYFDKKDDYIKYDLDQEDPNNKLINYEALPGFKTNAKFQNSAKEKVLSDENGNVIIGVRSEFGIHLMIVQKSIYDFTEDPHEVSLEKYYTTAIPGDNDFPTVKDADNKDVQATTYVNFINSVNKSEYNTRADAVKSAIKGFDSTYDYRLYEQLVDEEGVDKTNEKTKVILDNIDNYIAIQREKNAREQSEGLEDVWQTYVELLQSQDAYRKAATNNRIISEGCKIAFTKTGVADTEYKEGKICYVK